MNPESPELWWIAAIVLAIVLIVVVARRRARERSIPTRSGAGGEARQGDAPSAGSARSTGDEPSRTKVVHEVEPSVSDQAESSEEELLASLQAVDVPEALGHDNELRLEISRVYLELGDSTGALRLLNLVLEEGDLGQRDAARAMLERISEAAMDPDDGAGRSADAEDRLSVENLLDLATAYVEIGDAKSARDLIARIDEFGDAYQRNQAAKLQERLGRSR